MRISVSCLPGMEEILESELTAIGGKSLIKQRQAISFDGNDRMLLQCLTDLPSALRVYQEITEFRAASQQDLYRRLVTVAWERFLRNDQSFSIEVIESGGRAPGPVRYITLKAKDALVDRIRDKTGNRPSVDRNNPDIRFLIVFGSGGASLLRDASGAPLSQRGYRLRHSGAPLNEVLAWGLLNFSGFADAAANFTGGSLIDPMCGSGTISIEAALYVKRLGIPPHPVSSEQEGVLELLNGTNESSPDESMYKESGSDGLPMEKKALADSKPRPATAIPPGKIAPSSKKPKAVLIAKKSNESAGRDYMCFAWPDKGSRLRAMIKGQINEPPQKKPDMGGTPSRSSDRPSCLIIASDIDQRAVSIARENARRAGVEEYIFFAVDNFIDLRSNLEKSEGRFADLLNPEADNGFIILNPPYDRRLTLDEDDRLYEAIGDCLKQDWKGYSAHVFSANKQALKQIGLRSEKRRSLKNGQLEASLHSFSLY